MPNPWLHDDGSTVTRDLHGATVDEVLASLSAARTVIGKSFQAHTEAVNCHHNYVQRETHFGQDVYVTRKGAVSAKAGQLSTSCAIAAKPRSASAMAQRYTDCDGIEHAMGSANILVVAPYNDQVNLLRIGKLTVIYTHQRI